MRILRSEGAWIVIVMGVAILFAGWYGIRPAFGSAPSGLPATYSTSSKITLVANTAQTIFATSTCSARIISASSTVLFLTFTDARGDSPTGNNGIRQPANTTVAYDSGQYGCGAVKVLSLTADGINIMETQ